MFQPLRIAVDNRAPACGNNELVSPSTLNSCSVPHSPTQVRQGIVQTVEMTTGSTALLAEYARNWTIQKIITGMPLMRYITEDELAFSQIQYECR